MGGGVWVRPITALRQAWEIVRPEPRHSRGRISEFRLIPSASNFSFLISRGSAWPSSLYTVMLHGPSTFAQANFPLRSQILGSLPSVYYPIHSSRHVYTCAYIRKLCYDCHNLHLSLSLPHPHRDQNKLWQFPEGHCVSHSGCKEENMILFVRSSQISMGWSS